MGGGTTETVLSTRLRATPAATAFVEPVSAPSSSFSATRVHSDLALKSSISNFFLALSVIPPLAVLPDVALPGMPREPLPFITTCAGWLRVLCVRMQCGDGAYAATAATSETSTERRMDLHTSTSFGGFREVGGGGSQVLYSARVARPIEPSKDAPHHAAPLPSLLPQPLSRDPVRDQSSSSSRHDASLTRSTQPATAPIKPDTEGLIICDKCEPAVPLASALTASTLPSKKYAATKLLLVVCA